MQSFWVFATALSITAIATWVLIPLAKRTGFYDMPNERSAHHKPALLIGGLAFAIGTLLSLILWWEKKAFSAFSSTIISLALIAIIGWVDDWLRLSPIQKLLGQVVVAVLLVGWAGVRLEHLEGIFCVGPLPWEVSMAISILSVVGIINAFNFMDGINGLAGGMGLWVCVALGGWMYAVRQVEYALLAIALGGALCSFLYFNTWHFERIFMGDAGSMFIGATAAALTLKFLSLNRNLPEEHFWRVSSGPALAVAVLFVPLVDEVRVFIVRLLHGQSPFYADRRHVHHCLLARGFTHCQASLLLVSVNVIISLLAWYFHNLGNHVLLLGEGALALAASAWLSQR
ncbi:MAG: undecaprenyl/decaprenyl-phosphate alpha-N-acetylglucosaminyl 1-phosphate transferase [Saprospiraceae bacterium]|nr:undecaprenyl/decaprenyl-phosphate alpha-N-acetylglucosaminyl 1-phosphate transferase [Saprospiraceae bacterium]MDW8484829.1 MraY family glycosyltransferase [Saprospiraceae bacterium]